MIYRWAQQALATPADHPLLPLVWQKFFQLYLRQPGPEFGCVKQKHSVFIWLVIVFLVSGFLKWRFTNFLNISSCYFSSLKCRCYTMHVGFKVHGVRFMWKCSACSSSFFFFSLALISLFVLLSYWWFHKFHVSPDFTLFVAVLMTHKTDVPALWLTQLLCSVLWYMNIMSNPFHVFYWKKLCTAWMHSKSLWIKASAKCVNVNVKCPVFVSILLFLYLHNISFNYMTEIL